MKIKSRTNKSYITPWTMSREIRFLSMYFNEISQLIILPR